MVVTPHLFYDKMNTLKYIARIKNGKSQIFNKKSIILRRGLIWEFVPCFEIERHKQLDSRKNYGLQGSVVSWHAL